MVQDPIKNSDDFFTLIEKEQEAKKPAAQISDDEIIFKDEHGKLKILKGDKVLDYDGPIQSDDLSQGVVAKPEETANLDLESEPETDSKPIGQPLNLDQEIENVVKNSGLNFVNPDDEKRFRNIVRSRIRGVRNNLQTKESLQESSLTGGMGYDDETVKKVLALINQELQDFDNKHRGEIGSDQFLELQKEAQKILAEPVVKEVEDSFSDRPVFQPPVKQVEDLKIEAKPETKPSNKTTDAPMVNRPVISEVGSRPKIEDVKFKPKLTGPIEEIRTMTLKDFRRLSPSPETSIQKILDKMAVLEEESFAKKIQAVKAWKESEVNRIYLAIADQGMEEHKPVENVIAERTAQGLPTLTEEELEAVFSLNKKLRY